MYLSRTLGVDPREAVSGRTERGSQIVGAGFDRLGDRDGDRVLPDPRWQHHGTAVGIGKPSEERLIGGHAKRLIIAPDDHPIEEAPGRAK